MYMTIANGCPITMEIHTITFPICPRMLRNDVMKASGTCAKVKCFIKMNKKWVCQTWTSMARNAQTRIIRSGILTRYYNNINKRISILISANLMEKCRKKEDNNLRSQLGMAHSYQGMVNVSAQSTKQNTSCVKSPYCTSLP